jgi:hypothetical protein
LTPIYKFVPVTVETQGALGEEADDFISELGRRIASVMGEKRATEFMLQRLSALPSNMAILAVFWAQ